jgi:putative restriction endonuclease
MSDRTFGEISGIPVGSTYLSRQEMSRLGIHRPTQAGISGSATEGADSIVLSGGYEDDEDFGEVIVYTGHGGQDPVTRQQIANQELTRQNLALAVSMQQGLPVRVIRGSTHQSSNAPKSGYRYDGLYTVERYWHEKGAAGFKVWRYRLVRRSEAPPIEGPVAALELSGGNSTPGRFKTSVSRVIRDTALSAEIKKLYDYSCQVCGARLQGPAGPYAEAAHVRPLGRPHNGPDTPDNLVCLCPNHHYLFDVGAFAIRDDLSLAGLSGRLVVHERHPLNADYLRYHREHFGLIDELHGVDQPTQ